MSESCFVFQKREGGCSLDSHVLYGINHVKNSVHKMDHTTSSNKKVLEFLCFCKNIVYIVLGSPLSYCNDDNAKLHIIICTNL